MPVPASTLTITGASRVMFIMGDPIDQVIGTATLNAHWADLGRDLVTVPLHTRPEHLAGMLDAIRQSPSLAGTGITIPHKIAALSLVDHMTEAARRVGSVNFIRRNPDGSLTGHNVDGAGFLEGLSAQGIDPAGLSVALAGAGGVARAIAFALVGAGIARLTLSNRNSDKATALAEDLATSAAAAGCAITVHPPGDRIPEGAELLINATSLGMRASDPLPFAEAQIVEARILAEVVMRPADTAFLARGHALGLTCVPGHAMLAPQADLVARFLDGDTA